MYRARRLLPSAALLSLTVALALSASGIAIGAGAGAGSRGGSGQDRVLSPLATTEADWRPVADALGRSSTLMGGTVYRIALPRTDLAVTSRGITIKPGLSLGGYAASRATAMARW
jgi:hypothetical protein